MGFTSKLLPLLSRRLYTNKFSALRELVQNSVDACSIRKINEANYIPLIQIYFNENELVIEDNGIGMTFSDICNYFLKIGRSSKIEKYYYESVVGKFGIGILSVFNLGPKATITTKNYLSDKVYQFEIEEGVNLDTNLDIKIKENSAFTGTRVSVDLFNNIFDDLNRDLLKSYYFHYSGDIKVDFHPNKMLLKFRFKWREFDYKKIKLRWNYRKRIQTSGSLPVESNYLNSFLVREFKIESYDRKWSFLKKSIIIDYIEKNESIHINLSRENARVDFDEDIIDHLSQDVNVDLYANYLCLDIKTLLRKHKENFNFDRLTLKNLSGGRKPLKNEIIFFKSGYIFFDDLSINEDTIILSILDIKHSIILKTIKLLPPNVGFCFSMPKQFLTFIFKKNQPRDYPIIMKKLGNLDLGLFFGVSDYKKLVELKSLANYEILGNSGLKATFEDKLIPYGINDRQVMFKESFDKNFDRIQEVKLINDFRILY